MFSQKCKKRSGREGKESNTRHVVLKDSSSSIAMAPWHFSDFLETGTPHLNGYTGCQAWQRNSRDVLRENRDRLLRKGRDVLRTRCVCLYNATRLGETKENQRASDDPVHHWLAGFSTRERLLNEMTAWFYIKHAILWDAHKRESRIVLQCLQSFRDHTETC